MSDSENSKNNDKDLQECCVSDEGDGNNNRDVEDDKSGIGTLSEYNAVVERTEVGESSSGAWNRNVSNALQYSEGMNREDLANVKPKALRRHTEGNLVNQSSERNAGFRKHSFAGSRRNNIQEDDYEVKTTAPRLYEKETQPEKGSVKFGHKTSRRYTDGVLPHQMSSGNTGLRRHTFAGGSRNDVYEDDYQLDVDTSRLSNAEMKGKRSSENFRSKGSRRYTESDIPSQTSSKNSHQRRHTFAGGRRNDVNADDYQREIDASRLSSAETKEEKSPENFQPKGSRRFTESDMLGQISSRNADQRRHIFAGSRRKDIYNNDYQPFVDRSRLSSAEMKEQSSENFRPKGSRRYTESDIRSQTCSRNADQRRHTFAGNSRKDIYEDDYQPEIDTSRLSSAEKAEKPKGSRRYTESDKHIHGQTSSRNAGHRRHTLTGSRLDDIEEDDYLAETNTSAFSKSFSDTEIDVAKDFNRNLFRSQNSNISRRNTFAGDIVGGLRELLGKTVEGYHGNTSRFPDKGSNPDVLSEDDIRDCKTETLDEDVISTSKDEQNLMQVRGQYEAFKRHTIAGYGSEYNHGRIPSRNWFTSDEPDTKIKLGDRQRSSFKRHTIAGTSHGMDVLLGEDERKLLQNLAKSPQRIEYVEDKRLPERTLSINQGIVGEIQQDIVLDYIPAPLKQHSVSGQVYVPDVNLDKDTGIDGQPRRSSLSQRHTIHTDRQGDIPKPRTRGRATHDGLVQDRQFILQDSFNDNKTDREDCLTRSVRRGSTGGDVEVDKLPFNNEHSIGNTDNSTRKNSAYGRPFEHRDSLHRREDEMEKNVKKIERYYVSSDNQTDREYAPRTPRSSSPYITSDNELRIHERDALRSTNIFVEEANPTNSMKIQTPGMSITRSGVQHREVVANQQTKDLKTNTISTNYIALSSSVAPLPESRVNNGVVQPGSQMMPTRNILLRGQDEQGNKLKFHLSVIEEESDEEYYRELEMQSQETEEDHVSTNGVKTVTMTRSQCHSGESGLVENEKHIQQPSTSIIISNDGVAINDQGQSEISLSRNMESHSCTRAKDFKQHVRCHVHTSVETTSGTGQENVKQTEQQRENEKSERDVISIAHKSVQSEQTSSKSHSDTHIDLSHKKDDTSSGLPCSLHGKYQLHHPICCWHMTNNRCNECNVKQRGGVTRELNENNDTITSETTDSELSQTNQTSERFNEHAQKTKRPSDIFPNCGDGLQIGTAVKKALEAKPYYTESIQGKVQDLKHQSDTSSERGDYKTAQESSICEDDFKDIKLYSDAGWSSVHHKSGRKRRHRKSYKNKPRRKGSFERHRVCYVTL